MKENRDWIAILAADDSREDRHLLDRAFQAAGLRNRLDFVRDGQELIEQLERSAEGGPAALPGIIILDVKMPRLDGMEALQWIRADPRFALLPVILLTTSHYRQDILDGYRLGANSVITKPFSYDDFVELATMLKRYWLEHVELPAQFKNQFG